jgi:hypothetical protein
MSWRPPPTRVAPAPWFRAITDLFRSPDIVTREGVGLTITEAVHELAEAVRELSATVRKVNGLYDDDP